MFRRNHRKHISLNGHGLAEYAIIGVLVAAVSVIGVTVFANNLNHWLLGLKSDMKSSGKTVAVIETPQKQPTETATQAPPTPEALPSGQQITPPTGSLAITTPNGTSIVLSNYPVPISTTVTTAGVNGTTGQLASNIAIIADQLLQNHEITPQQANLLKALANQGHRMAMIERTIEDFANTSPYGNGKLEMASIPFEGREYHKDDLSLLLTGKGSEGKVFEQLYQQAMAQGALNDPGIQAVVSQLFSDITATAQAFHEATWMADYAGEITEGTASKLTNHNSAGICGTGGGEDSGINCS